MGVLQEKRSSFVVSIAIYDCCCHSVAMLAQVRLCRVRRRRVVAWLACLAIQMCSNEDFRGALPQIEGKDEVTDPPPPPPVGNNIRLGELDELEEAHAELVEARRELDEKTKHYMNKFEKAQAELVDEAGEVFQACQGSPLQRWKSDQEIDISDPAAMFKSARFDDPTVPAVLKASPAYKNFVGPEWTYCEEDIRMVITPPTFAPTGLVSCRYPRRRFYFRAWG